MILKFSRFQKCLLSYGIALQCTCSQNETFYYITHNMKHFITKLITFYYITHFITYLITRFTRNQSSNTSFMPSWNITAGKRAFKYRAATNWNKLPGSVRSNFSDMSLNEFKGVISHNSVIFFSVSFVFKLHMFLFP